MADQLFARILSAPLDPQYIEWGVFRGREMILGPRKGTLDQMKQALSELYPEPPMIRVCVFAPMEWMTTLSTSMPSVQPKVLSKALPFALEEQLAEDVDHLHFVVMGKPSPDRVQVAVISKVVLSIWVSNFRAAGYPINELVPDSLCIPYGMPEHWSIIFSRNRVMLRVDKFQGMAFQGSQVAVMLDAVFEDIGVLREQLRLTLINHKDEAMAGKVLDALASEIDGSEVDTNIEIERKHISRPLLEILAHSLINMQIKRQVPNLLTGGYRQEVKRQRINIRWKPVVALVFMCFLLQSTFYIWQGHVYSKEADRLSQEAVALYQDWFPEERISSAGSIRRQLQVKLKTAGNAGPGFLQMLQMVGQEIYQIDQGRNDNIQVRRLAYEHQNGLLRLELSLSDFSTMGKLKNAITRQGAQVEEDAANRGSDGRVTARVRVLGL